MGHYWSEMQSDTTEETHPYPLQAMDFFDSELMDTWHKLWIHRPCLQVFFIGNGSPYMRKVPDEIYWHANHCPKNGS